MENVMEYSALESIPFLFFFFFFDGQQKTEQGKIGLLYLCLICISKSDSPGQLLEVYSYRITGEAQLIGAINHFHSYFDGYSL